MLPSKSFPSHTITFLPGPNEFSGFIVLLIFPARLNILAVTLSELDKSNKIFVWGNSKTEPPGEKILGWHVIISALSESTWNKLSDLNAAYMPNSDNSDCK